MMVQGVKNPEDAAEIYNCVCWSERKLLSPAAAPMKDAPAWRTDDAHHVELKI